MFFTERSAAEFSSGGTPEVAGPPGRRQLSTAACNRKHRPPNCGQNPGPPTRVLLGLLAIWGVLVAQAPPSSGLPSAVLRRAGIRQPVCCVRRR